MTTVGAQGPAVSRLPRHDAVVGVGCPAAGQREPLGPSGTAALRFPSRLPAHLDVGSRRRPPNRPH